MRKFLQTFAEFQEQYWTKIDSFINREINLNMTLMSQYSQQCHEATLALAYALNSTLRGIHLLLVIKE